MYAFVENNPVNRTDFSGLCDLPTFNDLYGADSLQEWQDYMKPRRPALVAAASAGSLRFSAFQASTWRFGAKWGLVSSAYMGLRLGNNAAFSILGMDQSDLKDISPWTKIGLGPTASCAWYTSGQKTDTEIVGGNYY